MFLLFDIGGTTTRMAISHTGDKVDDVKLFPTNHDFASAMEEMRKVAYEFSNGEKYHAVVGGVRAYDRKKGTLFNQPNFPMWVDAPLLETMKSMWGDVYLENDAVMVGLGEAIYGAGKGFDIVAYITLSTGVGGCRITKGRVDSTEYSFEPGNMLISDSNGGSNYLEDLVSGSAIEKKYGKNPFELEDQNAWREIEDLVAVGLNNVIVMWSPDLVVLGGSVPQRINFENVNRRVKELCKIYPVVPEVKIATIDEEGGLYGGLAYLKNLP
ncbi:MAG: ROK family protein [Candidatus Levybacteria bacterium]|nr:ROK family protein [Candidatus Levybacteria bacterium]